MNADLIPPDTNISNQPTYGPSEVRSEAAFKKKEGTLPDGTPCCCASEKEIVECVKTVAEYYEKNPPTWDPITFNCADFVLDILSRCCLKEELRRCSWYPHDYKPRRSPVEPPKHDEGDGTGGGGW